MQPTALKDSPSLMAGKIALIFRNIRFTCIHSPFETEQYLDAALVTLSSFVLNFDSISREIKLLFNDLLYECRIAVIEILRLKGTVNDPSLKIKLWSYLLSNKSNFYYYL